MDEVGWATPMEAALWKRLRTRWPGWVREYSTGPYRLDFYCPAAKLAVEVDGSSHASHEAARHDMQRDGWHRDRGILTLRVTNRDVEVRRSNVVFQIDQAVRDRAPAASWWARWKHGRAVHKGRVHTGPPIERVVTAADRPLEIKDPVLTEAMRRLSRLEPPEPHG